MNNEKQLYEHIKAKSPQHHWQRIESGITAGIPDVSVGLQGLGDGWLELKIGHSKKDGTVDVLIRTAQHAWMHRRAKINQHCYYVVAVEGVVFIVKPAVFASYSKITTTAADAKKRLIRFNIPAAVLSGIRVEIMYKILGLTL